MTLRIGNKPNAELGFTLVEVMISVVILGFGLAIIIQSFASAIRGLDSCQNYIQSLRFAQDKMNELTLTSLEEKGSSPKIKSGEVKLGNRQFNWQTEISEILKPEYLSKDFVEVSVNLDWRERGISKNSTLVTYLPKKKEEQEK